MAFVQILVRVFRRSLFASAIHRGYLNLNIYAATMSQCPPFQLDFVLHERSLAPRKASNVCAEQLAGGRVGEMSLAGMRDSHVASTRSRRGMLYLAAQAAAPSARLQGQSLSLGNGVMITAFAMMPRYYMYSCIFLGDRNPKADCDLTA